MKVIVAGSREISDPSVILGAMQASEFIFTEIVSGGARGVDKIGERIAKRRKIPVRVFPAHWGVHGLRAGPIRNAEMGAYADGLVAIWDGKSTGTKHMIETMRRLKKPVHVSLVRLA